MCDIQWLTLCMSYSMYINTLIVYTSYTVLHNHCIMTMTQYITLLYVLTLFLLSTVAPLDNNTLTTCKYPPSAALYSGVLPSYNNNISAKLLKVNTTHIHNNWQDNNYTSVLVYLYPMYVVLL